MACLPFRNRLATLVVCLCAAAAARTNVSPGHPSRALLRVQADAQEPLTTLSDASHHSQSFMALHSPNHTDQVEWDEYSLILKGQRVFIHSGEFHTFRLPVPDLWPDILEKMTAAGMNAVSLYTHMGLINPAPGVVDMDGFRALQPFFDACKKAGLWVVLRPGPYINAETTAGGIAHWITSEVQGSLRSNASDFRASWEPYIQSIINATVANQIHHGGPVIAVQLDNEYAQADWAEGGDHYFEQLKEAFRKGGIEVPLTYNDPGQDKTFVNGTGAADLYGLDAYPQRFDCSNPDVWNEVPKNWHDFHRDTNPSQPFYSPEFQAGAFDPWGPHAPGYDACRELTGPAFESVFYLSLWAANAKMVNYYMVFGGTSWGALPFPGVYTSYDYGSPISETRELNDKYAELKRQGLFLRSSPDFYKTEWVGNSSDASGAVALSNPDAFAVHLRNPDSQASFYIVRQTNSSSTVETDFTMRIDTKAGPLQLPRLVPAITLSGRQAKVIIADYSFGGSTLLYSTASVLFAGRIGQRDVLFLHGDERHAHEASIVLRGTRSTTSACTHPLVSVSERARTGDEDKSAALTFLPGITGLVTVYDTPTQLVLYADSATAGTFWAPPLARADGGAFAQYWGVGTNASVLVGGPYLVRSARLDDGHLTLRGDLKDDVRLFLFAPPDVKSLSWNGVPVVPDAMITAGGFSAVLSSQARALAAPIAVPRLEGWRYADSLPEIQRGFSDENWTIADHTATNIPYPPHFGDGRVLYGCDYGFCEGIVIWRGHFNGTGNETAVRLAINGGEAFAASVWLNGVFLSTAYGNSTNNRVIIEETDETYEFPANTVRVGEQNVIAVVQDNMGLDESGSHPDESKSPRGIRGFALAGGNIDTWKVQGKIGGYQAFPDRLRGIFNEGGLYGERRGWHLPGFDVSTWTQRDLAAGLPGDRAGAGFFATNFTLAIPEGYDVPISFVFDNKDQPYRSLLYVNGWNMGKRVANLGPQYRFPVPEGILNYNGVNTVVVAVWAMEERTVSPRLRLEIDGVYDGGVKVTSSNPVWSGEGREA